MLLTNNNIDILNKAKLIYSILLFSKGMSFLYGFDEVFRTKNNEANSYNLGDNINGFDYTLLEKNKGLTLYLKELIKLRKRLKFISKDKYIFSIEKDNIFSIKYLDYKYYFLFNNKINKKEIIFDEKVEIIFNFENNVKIISNILNFDYGFYVWRIKK